MFAYRMVCFMMFFSTAFDEQLNCLQLELVKHQDRKTGDNQFLS